MADVTPGEQPTLEQRLERSDPVFARLATVIRWIRPAVWGDTNQVANIRLATGRFAHCWDELLPDERERALDLLLSSLCDLEAGVAGWTMVMYRDLKAAAKRSRVWHKHGMAAAELEQLVLEVNQVVDSAGPADVDKAAAASFRASFLCDNGVTTAKLKRMQDAEWEHCATEVAQGLERIRAGTSAAQALPSVDQILARAHDVAQTPDDRFALFTRCVDDILQLYHKRHLPHVSPEQHLDYLQHARSILLSPAEALSFTRSLSHERQRVAVRLARQQLYSACSERMSGNELPLLRGIVNELCSAVMVDFDPSTIRPPSMAQPDLVAPHSSSSFPHGVNTGSSSHLAHPGAPRPHENRSLGVSSQSPFFPLSRRSAW